MGETKKKIPKSLDPLALKGSMRVKNNQMPHWIITPSFWCATNLFTFIFMLLLGLGFFFYHETTKLNDFMIRYDD